MISFLIPLFFLSLSLFLQLVSQHADLQDTSAATPLPAAGEAEGGLSGAPRPYPLHLQPGPRHQEHSALTLLRQVRDWTAFGPRPRIYTYTVYTVFGYIIQQLLVEGNS